MVKSAGSGLGDYVSTPLMLERTPKKHNILIGNDKRQIRWAEQFLSAAHDFKVRHEVAASVTDDMVHAEEPRLYVVERSSFIDLAATVKSRIGIWDMTLIEEGTAGHNAIVRAGAMMVMIKPTKDAVAAIAKKMPSVIDIRASIWHAAELWLLGVPEKSSGAWLQPWENWLAWMPQGVDPEYRLNTLYWDLVRWTFARTGDERGFKKIAKKFDQKRWIKFQTLQLPKDKVYQSLVELSTYKQAKQHQEVDPWVCALKIAKVWESKR